MIQVKLQYDNTITTTKYYDSQRNCEKLTKLTTISTFLIDDFSSHLTGG